MSPYRLTGADWKKIREADGVEVFAKSVDNSGLIAFKGVTILPGSVPVILSVLRNEAGWHEWIEMYDFGRILERKKKFHAIIYQAFDMPPLISDRDLVMESKVSALPDGRSVEVKSHSVEHPDAPKTVGVRINLTFSNWVLTPVSDNESRAILEVHSNPGGYIPQWLTNYVQRSYVTDLFSRLRDYLKRKGQDIVASDLPAPAAALGPE